MTFNIPKPEQYVLDTLNKNGFEAYVVGGCVRDMMLGKQPYDFDVTTNASPDIITEIFEKTVPTGISHGTVTVIVQNTPIEVTTYRTDGNYSDNRHPDNVQFVSKLEYDLSRRDFTVNAMAYSHSSGVVDMFSGKADLENKILRTVGDPERRFSEDALRIMRLFRFASTLDFKIEQNTYKTALEKAQLLKGISVQRIYSELKKCIAGKNPAVLKPLIETGVFSPFGIEKFDTPHLLTQLKNTPELRLFAFLHLCSCQKIKTLTFFKASNKEKKYCLDMENALQQSNIKDALNVSGKEIYLDLLLFKKAILGFDISADSSELERIICQNEPYCISHLKISGKDLELKGIKGEKIGQTLENLRREVCKHPEYNTKEKLIKMISN